MSKNWLRAIISRKVDAADPDRVYELLVLEGVDAGEKFTVDGDEVLVGRRVPNAEKGRGVLLKDPTVSAKQAVIRRRGDQLIVQHLAGATNPTLVDGRPAYGEPIREGSEIKIGRVRLQLRGRDGIAISGLTQVPALPDEVEVADGRASPTEKLDVPGYSSDPDTTEIRPVLKQLGSLVVERGRELARSSTYPIWSKRNVIGRAPNCEIQLADMGISRSHAEIVVEGSQLFLVHTSKVNPTLLNGCEVLDRELVRHGDEIQLADRVVLRVELEPANTREQTTPGTASAPVSRSSLKQAMESKIELDRSIEQKYHVNGSFLDVDIVNSYGMKTEEGRADHIVVSFERFRAFVGAVVAEYGGQVLNSNGDELMCYFASTLESVRAGSAILERLPDFNRDQNLLRVPFRFRIGIHTGSSLVDLDQGVAYSPVLDAAGHLQKFADVDGMMISEQTYTALPEGMPFEHAGTMEREGFAYYRLVGRLE